MTDPTHALLVATDSTVIYGDSVSELVDHLLDGHSAAALDEQLEMRLEALANAAAHAQAAVLADHPVEGLDEDTLTVFMHDRLATVIAFEEYDGEIPLFLLATSYAPFSAVPAPAGKAIVWLDPSTELTFLQSLGATGAVELLVRE